MSSSNKKERFLLNELITARNRFQADINELNKRNTKNGSKTISKTISGEKIFLSKNDLIEYRNLIQKRINKILTTSDLSKEHEKNEYNFNWNNLTNGNNNPKGLNPTKPNPNEKNEYNFNLNNLTSNNGNNNPKRHNPTKPNPNEKNEYNFNWDNLTNGNNNPKRPDIANIFYKVLTKKVRQLNNNSSNKWQLHLGSTIGKSYGGKNTKITDFLSIKTPIRQYVSNKPEGLWTSGLYKEYNTVNLSTNSNAHNELNSKEECSIRNTSFINWISSQSRSNDGPNTKYDPRGKTDFLIVKGDKSQILQITTLKEFEAFDRKYRTIDQFGRVGIDWIRVAQKYSGINITPYQEEYGMKRDHWYNGWDCASQVIWDPIAIKEIRKLNLDTINFNSIRSGNLNINNINLNTINFDVIHKK